MRDVHGVHHGKQDDDRREQLEWSGGCAKIGAEEKSSDRLGEHWDRRGGGSTSRKFVVGYEASTVRIRYRREGVICRSVRPTEREHWDEDQQEEGEESSPPPRRRSRR